MYFKIVSYSLITLILGAVLGYYIGYGFGFRNTSTDLTKDKNKPQEYAFESDVIRVHTPLASQVITSPVTVRGQVVGNWLFEASMPIAIIDSLGNTLGIGFAMTADDWMTTDFVSIEGVVEFDSKGAQEGFIVLQKDNPSGLLENDDDRRMPIKFK